MPQIVTLQYLIIKTRPSKLEKFEDQKGVAKWSFGFWPSFLQLGNNQLPSMILLIVGAFISNGLKNFRLRLSSMT